MLSVIMLALIALQGPPTPTPTEADTTVPDVIVIRPSADKVFCTDDAPRAGSRVRTRTCRTYGAMLERAALEQEQADMLSRTRGRSYITDSRVLDAVAEGLALSAESRRARARMERAEAQ